MKRTIFLLFLALVFSASAFAHEAFTLVSHQKKTIRSDDLAKVETERTAGKIDKTTLTFTQNEIRLVVTTGPEDDMLSYRIQGVRNPTIVVPAGATLKILFVNVDEDMRHDIRFGHVMGDFPIAPAVTETVGTEQLAPASEDETLQAEEIVLKAGENGVYKYFCSVRGHAKGGMWGNIAVGVKPEANMKMPAKTQHVHSPDEDKMENMPGMQGGNIDHQHEMEMSSVTNIGDPMTRESSGTAWAPESSPMYARMKMFEDGSSLMFMGNMFLRYTQIGSDRDVSVAGKGSRQRVDAPSMFMAMYSKPINERSQFGFRVMMSLDPLIERGYGYPLLYQSGEQFRGGPIHDRQHPHDFFTELSASYSYKFNDKNSFYFYAGYPGEPALGPPTFMHRISAMNNPNAPISHHWQDSTHITWGVLTAGYSFGKVKFEASAFKGKEPDENRWNFDKPKLDSFSGRLSWNPTKDWAFQISHGYLKNPEPSEPELRILRRTTASAIYNKQFGDEKNWASTFAWGQNYGDGERSNSFLFESNYDFYKNAVFGRIERVQKSGHELVLDPPDEHKIFWVGAYSLGYVRDIVKDRGIDVGMGAMFTANTNPSTLNAYYGETTHGGWQVFLRFRPSKMKH